MATIPMIAPDGSSGDIPAERVKDAIAAGAKLAVPMTAPDGSSGYIPVDRVADARAAGAKDSPQDHPGFWENLGHTLGIGTQEAADRTAHPVQSVIMGMPGVAPLVGAYQGAKRIGGEILQAGQSLGQGNVPGAAVHAINAIPVVGPALNQMADQAPPTTPGQSYASRVASAATPGNVGTAIGTAAQVAPAVLGGLDAAAPDRAVIPTPNPVGAAKSALYPQSQSLAASQSAARNLSKALVVEPAAAPNFIRAANDELPTVIGYAKDNNLPINSKVDFANAAKATADAVQQHFNSILDPYADNVTSVPASYRGTRVGEGPNATLGDINSRINAINQELNPNFRKGLASQTSAANVSDADLIAEKQALTNTLHSKLAAETGLDPSDIADIRQQAGKLRTIADESNLSANRDTAAAGRQAMGSSTGALATKSGIIDRTLQAVQGGPEIIGNRQLLSAIKDVQPQSLNLPQPTTTAAPVAAPSRLDQMLAEAKAKFAQRKLNDATYPRPQ